jgi:RNA polymerase primary sigma factor
MRRGYDGGEVKIMKKREISNETMLMAAIFGPWPPDTNERYHDEINGVSLHDALVDAINSIAGQNETKVSIVILERFGMTDGKLKTFKEVGEILNISATRAVQILASGLRRLRHPARSTTLKLYVK